MSRKVINIVKKKNKINQFNLSLNPEDAMEVRGQIFSNLEGIENFDPTAEINVATITGVEWENTVSLTKIHEESTVTEEGEENVMVVYNGFLIYTITVLSISIVAIYPKQRPEEYNILSVAQSVLFSAG